MSCGETLHLWDLTSMVTETSHSGLFHNYSCLQLHKGTAIRLVILLAGRFYDPILCTMATVDLYSERYDAVSYTWATEEGDDRKIGRIHFPDGVVAITQNCEAALRQLRLESEPRQLWVDAICIDQSNLSERNHQVSIMGQVYRTASTVRICIQDLSRRYTECIRLFSGADLNNSTDTMRCHHSEITQAKELFRRRYFSRVWVLSAQYTMISVS
jgi:hypothetical protein